MISIVRHRPFPISHRPRRRRRRRFIMLYTTAADTSPEGGRVVRGGGCRVQSRCSSPGKPRIRGRRSSTGAPCAISATDKSRPFIPDGLELRTIIVIVYGTRFSDTTGTSIYERDPSIRHNIYAGPRINHKRYTIIYLCASARDLARPRSVDYHLRPGETVHRRDRKNKIKTSVAQLNAIMREKKKKTNSKSNARRVIVLKCK